MWILSRYFRNKILLNSQVLLNYTKRVTYEFIFCTSPFVKKICRLLCRKCRKKELTRSDFEPTLYWKEKPFLLYLANAGLLAGYNLKSIDSLTTLLNRCCEDKSIFGGLGFHLRRFAFFASTLNAGKNRMWRLSIHGFWNEYFFVLTILKKMWLYLGYALPYPRQATLHHLILFTLNYWNKRL